MRNHQNGPRDGREASATIGGLRAGRFGRPLLSLFSGAGGFDLGFEEAGFHVGAAYDIRSHSVASFNRNRGNAIIAECRDLRRTSADDIETKIGTPIGVIGGPPCQSFSTANSHQRDNDPRHQLPFRFAALLGELNKANGVLFFAFENVPGLLRKQHAIRMGMLKKAFRDAGFSVSVALLNALDYGVPQKRARLFMVGYNTARFGDLPWFLPQPLRAEHGSLSVRNAIGSLPEPVIFADHERGEPIPFHPNHWCMTPRSSRFVENSLAPGDAAKRSFKTLHWDRPSLTVSYGNREVHVHPKCHRRLSVYEAMQLQGFPKRYVLEGTLSSQITQVSEAVPPPLAYAVAASIASQLETARKR